MRATRLLLLALGSVIAITATEPNSIKTAVLGADASVTQYLVALPHIAYGGGWRTQIVVSNTSGVAADITLYYYGNDGAPLSLAVSGVFADHAALTVPAYGAQTLEPDWQGANTISGWVGLVYTNSGLKVQGIFMWHSPADPADKYIESTAPILSQTKAGCIIPLPSGSSSLTMPFDETEGRSSGYGFANTTNAAVTMTLAFYDQNGQRIAEYSERLASFGHNQFLLRDKAPSLINHKGTMQVTGLGVVPLGFRFTPFNTFTTWLP